MNNYTKLFSDLANMDEMIKNKDKVLILLSYLPDDDYEIFVLTLINGKKSLSYNEKSVALMNHKLRRKNKKSFNSTSAEALTVRGRSSNRKDKGDRGRSKSNSDLKKNQSAFCKEKGHQKIDCPKLKNKKKESKSDANIAKVKSLQVNGRNSDSLVVSLTITTSTVCYSNISVWILDTGTNTYHVCPKQD